MKWLYIIKNKISGKEYIGVSIDPKRRWDQHKRMATNCGALKDAMKKYGVDNFTFKLLCSGEDAYIDELEIKAIEKFNTQVPNGYNLTLGGDGTNYTKWNDEWNCLLGTKPDQELADELGVGYSVVSSRRHGLGISSYADSIRFKWDDYIHLLGTMPDNTLAEKLGVSSSSVGYKRNEMGIPVFKNEDYYEITPEIFKLLGKKSDPYISKMYNIPRHYIKSIRLENNIPSAKNESWVKTYEWCDNALKLVKDTSLTTTELSKLLKISRTTVQKKRKELGIKFDRKFKKPKHIPTSQLIEDLLNKNLTITFIAKKHNMSWVLLVGREKIFLKR